MATTMKRFTVSINSPIEQKLNLLKREVYYKSTQSEMIRDLITKGLDSLETEYKHNMEELKHKNQNFYEDKKDQSAHVND